MKRETRRYRCESCDLDVDISKQFDNPDETFVCAYCGKFMEEVLRDE